MGQKNNIKHSYVFIRFCLEENQPTESQFKTGMGSKFCPFTAGFDADTDELINCEFLSCQKYKVRENSAAFACLIIEALKNRLYKALILKV